MIEKIKKTVLIPKWIQEPVSLYSLNHFKNNKYKNSLRFLLSFKIYRIFLKNRHLEIGKRLASFFFKWLNTLLIGVDGKPINDPKIKKYFLTHFNFLVGLTHFYKINILYFSSNLKAFKIFKKIFFYSVQLTQLKLNKKFLLITDYPKTNYFNFENFSFLRKGILENQEYMREILYQDNWSNFSPPLYFSETLKDQLRHIYKKKKTSKEEK